MYIKLFIITFHHFLPANWQMQSTYLDC